MENLKMENSLCACGRTKGIQAAEYCGLCHTAIKKIYARRYKEFWQIAEGEHLRTLKNNQAPDRKQQLESYEDRVDDIRRHYSSGVIEMDRRKQFNPAEPI